MTSKRGVMSNLPLDLAIAVHGVFIVAALLPACATKTPAEASPGGR